MKKKLTAIILTILMMGTHLLTLGNAVIALSETVNNQNSKTNHANVEMNSYFEEESHSKTFEIGKDAKMYFKIKVRNTGYLKNTTIKLIDSNYEFDTNNFENEAVQSITTNEIKTKQINAQNEEVVIEVPIILPKSEEIAADLFAKVSKVEFTGTYIDGEGKERQIRKEVEQEVKWTATSEAEVAGEISKYIPYQNKDEYGVIMQAKVVSGIKDNTLPIKNTKLEISLPEIAIEQTNTEKNEVQNSNTSTEEDIAQNSNTSTEEDIAQNTNTSTEEDIAQDANTSTEDNTQNAETSTQQTSQNKIIKPERITVVANSSKATNGIDNGTTFGESNYHYEEETNKIIIDVKNEPNEQGKIAWGQGKDEYIITYVFVGKEVYDTVNSKLIKAKETTVTEEEKQEGKKNENAITGAITVEAGITVYQAEEQTLTLEGNIPYEIEDKIGNIVDFEIDTTKTISKGYIYANYDKTEETRKTEGKETTFELNYTAQVYDANLLTGLEFQVKGEKLIGEKETKAEKNIITKQITIAENTFQKMLGEEGKIEVTNTNGEVLGTINKETQKDNSQNYILNIEENKLNEITIKTTKPITEGKIEIGVEKAFVVEQTYSKEEMKDFAKIEVEATAKTDTESKTLQKTIDMTEPVSKAEISIGTSKLSTAVENKNVELRVVLDTSSNNNALYKNPSLQIILPNSIETIKINSTNLLLEDELKLKGETKVVEQDGRKVILVNLEGTQTKYMDNGIADKEKQENVIAKGANIVIKADITFKKLAPSSNPNIYLYYTNENTELFEEYYQKPSQKTTRTYAARAIEKTMAVGLATAGVQIVSPNGVVTENHMSNYKQDAEVSEITTNKLEENIPIYEEAREVIIGGTIINNYANSIENVFILGRTPFIGNKQIETDQNLGTTFDMKLKEKIEITDIDNSKVKVYYSTNGEATKDLLNTSNGWTEEPTNLSEVKSYLIIVSGEMATGAQLTFNYKVELPANLAYNNGAYAIYKTYYDNKTQSATIGETKMAGIIGVTTSTGPEVKITLTSNMPKEENSQEDIKLLPSGGAARFFAEVENTGKINVNNATVVIDTPTNTNVADYNEETGTYTLREKTITIGTLKPGEKKQISYYLLASKIKNSQTINVLKTKISLTADNIEGSIKSSETSLKILPSQFSIINKTNTTEDNLYSSTDIITYEIKLKNNTSECNTIITVPLPDNVNILEAYWNEGEKDIGIEKQSNQIIAKGAFSGNEKNLTVKFQLKDNTKTSFSTKVYASVEEAHEEAIKQIYSNEQYIYIDTPELSGTQKSPDKIYVKEAEEFSYNFTITTSEKGNHTNFVLEDTLPEEVEVLKTQVNIESKSNNSYGQIEKVKQEGNKLTITIPNVYLQSTVNIQIKARAKLNSKDDDGKQIINKAVIYSDQVSRKELNNVRQYLEYDEKVHQDPFTGDTPTNPGTQRYKLTGTAWLDANQDGKKDETEQLLSGIKVLLIYKSNSEVVKDVDTQEQKIVTTNQEGKYEFTNLQAGEYLVIFLYDASKYDITKYQAENVGGSYNSDAISMKIILDQKEQYAGVTDTIRIQNSNSRDIDIGLYLAEKFDLKLDKYISKITITTPSSGTKVYNYNNSKITKREIASKDVGSSSGIVEYKIVITNEGQVAGYARKIVDYLPETTKFNTEINKDWYLSNDQKAVYNASLADTILQPGESKEITLTLSFNINNKNIGSVIANQAEIYESYNEKGLSDFDSTEANQVATEDDISEAKIVLGIATGTIILYISLTLAIIMILGVGIFEIRKRVLKTK